MNSIEINNFEEKPNKILTVEKIDLEDLLKDFRISNLNCLSAYLKELWKDLVERSDIKHLGINKITFAKYYVLPGIIFERLYAVFDKNQNEYLDISEFLDGMMILFSDNVKNLLKFIFNFYDFDKDGFISKEDIRIVLSYIPLNQSDDSSIAKKYKLKFEKEEFRDRIESQNELFELLNKAFNNLEMLDLKLFIYTVENVSSEIFLYILIFLLEKRPFSKKTLEEFEGHRKYNTLLKMTKTPNPKNSMKSRILIASPNIMSKFSPSVSIRKSPFWSKRNLISLSNLENSMNNINSINTNNIPNKHTDFLNKLGLLGTNKTPLNTAPSKNILEKYSKQIVVDPFDNNNLSKKLKDIENNSTEEINTNLNSISTLNTVDNDQMMVDENVSIKNVPFFRKHRNNFKNLETLDTINEIDKNNTKNYTNSQILPAVKYGNSSNFNNTLVNQEKDNLNKKLFFNFTSIKDESDEEEDEVRFEGYLYKISRGKKLKKRYFKLIHKDLYYYRNQNDSYHKGLHNLSGIFVQDGQPLQFNEFYFYSFSMVTDNKVRTYYSDNENDYKNWLKYIKQVTGYLDLNDTYELKEKLGNGKFGIVRLGVHKETGRNVAIKMMHKKDMTISDMELIKTEIEILKVCQHPYIIRLYDVYENSEHIYIIMEYCEGGDLFSYIEKRNFKLPEHRAACLIHKLSVAVYYLHSYGITHRDLKPENILMTDNTDTGDIRLVDFGLSKIIGPNETCTEPFGTLSYVAPEVLLELPYNKSVDMWSLGIITYLLLTGCLPFDDENSEREVARKTIHEPIPFPNCFWKNLSLEARDFVTHLLQKDPTKRMNIKQVLEHLWIQKYNKTNLPEIRKKCKVNLVSTFKIYSTTD